MENKIIRNARRLLAAGLSAAVLSQPLFAVAATTINASDITANSDGGYALGGDTVIVMNGDCTLVYIKGQAYNLTISGSGTLKLAPAEQNQDTIDVNSLVVEDATIHSDGQIRAKIDITINSGTVVADGGGRTGLHLAEDGRLTINGGTVTAKSSGYGIEAKDIIINDGNVTAESGAWVGMIGETITINGGTTTAYGKYPIATTHAQGHLTLGTGMEIVSPEGYRVIYYDGLDVIVDQNGSFPSSVVIQRSGAASPTEESGNTDTEQPAAEPVKAHIHHHVWVPEKEATETEDALYLYRCSCGDVAGRSRVPNSAFYRFNVNAANQIAEAAQGGTVVIDARPGNWNAFHEMVYTAMRDRNDVTVQIEYRDHGEFFTLTVPAGSALDTLPGGSAYAGDAAADGCAGYLFLAQAVNAQAKPFAPWEK